MQMRLDHNGDARLHQGGGIAMTGTPVVYSTAAKSATRKGDWIHHFVDTDQGCRDVIRFIGERIDGYRAGRDPAAILYNCIARG